MAKNHHEGFASLFQTVEELTEKTYGDAARHDVELAKAKQTLKTLTQRLNEMETRRSNLQKKAAAADLRFIKEQQKTKQVMEDVEAVRELVQVKAAIVEKLRKRAEVTTQQVGFIF